MTLKVFAIGLPKTGTVSFSAAMRWLGRIDLHFYPPYVKRLIAGESPFMAMHDMHWDSLSNVNELPDEYRACDALYPRSKFILTTRCVENWLPSMHAQMALPWAAKVTRETLDARWQQLFGRPCRGEAFDANVFRTAFHAHDAGVRNYFKERPNDLLMLDLDAGENLMLKLCHFLGEPVPYPHANRRQ